MAFHLPSISMQNILPVESQLIQYAEFYKNIPHYVIITAAIWTLNIWDAVVDAHLYNFDISDDLSMQIVCLSP